MSFCPVCKADHPEGDAHLSTQASTGAATLCDASSSVTADPLIGQTLGHWMVVRKIGEGGMGVVYAAKEPVSGAQVAVKVLRLDEVNRIPEATFREKCLEEAKERFRREAEVARRLGENQPNIVQILGYGTLDDGRPYFAMEFLYGRSLDTRMRQDPAPTRDELRRWMEQACDALSVIHDNGVVHRDLKPDNIWISEPKTGKSFAKLLDFGISKVKGGPALTSPGMIPGTALYLAPERLSGSNDDPRSDIYAMGVILHEVLSGRPPFDAETVQGLYKMILMDPPPPVRPKAGLVSSPQLERLILDCLAKRPEDRPQTALELKARVLEALEDESVPTHLSPQAPQPEPSASLPGPETEAALAGMARARKGRMGWLVGGLAVLALAGVMGWRLANRSEKPTPTGTAAVSVPTPIAAVAPTPTVPHPPSALVPDAGAGVAVRKSAPRPRPGEKRLAGPLPASLQPEALSPPPIQSTSAPAKASPTPTTPERRGSTANLAPPEPAPGPVQARAREVIPSRSAKPSKADIDLITNEQILLGN